MELAEHQIKSRPQNKQDCYTSQLKFVFRLEENVSRAVGQNWLTPYGEKKLTNSLGKQQHNFRLARDQVVLLETPATLRASQRKVNDFFAFFFLGLSWEV